MKTTGIDKIAEVRTDNLCKSCTGLKLIDVTASKDLKKGTILDTSGAVYEGKTEPAYILAEDVPAAEEAQTVEVWQEGIFFRETIEAQMGYTITADDELKLRKVNILLESIV